MNKLEICNDVIDHWVTNLCCLYAGQHDEVSMRASKCALCRQFGPNDCRGCPLLHVNMQCMRVGSRYAITRRALLNGDKRSRKIQACERMIHTLEHACDYWMDL